MKIVSSQTDEERGEYRARLELRWALRRLAANLLRVVRGAGKPSDLGRQIQEVIEVYLDYREATGHFPESQLVSDALAVSKTDSLEDWKASFPDDVDDSHFERWLQDGSFNQARAVDAIVRASLQIAASRLLNQKTQERSAEHSLSQALDEHERSREEMRRAWESKTGKLPRRSNRTAQPRIRRRKSAAPG